MSSFADAVQAAFGVDFEVYNITLNDNGDGTKSWVLSPGGHVLSAGDLDGAKAEAVAYIADPIGRKAVGYWADLGSPESGYRIITAA